MPTVGQFMHQTKLLFSPPTAEAMLPDAPVSSVSPQPTSPNKEGAAADLTEGSNGTNITPGGNQTIYTCDQCDKTFTKKSSITRHKYEHSGKFLRGSIGSFFNVFKGFIKVP